MAGGLALIAIFAVPVAALCDWTENAGITATLKHFQQDGGPHPGDARRISRPSLIKWTILAAVLAIYGVAAFTRLVSWRNGLVGMAVIALAGTLLGASLFLMLIRYISERSIL